MVGQDDVSTSSRWDVGTSGKSPKESGSLFFTPFSLLLPEASNWPPGQRSKIEDIVVSNDLGATKLDVKCLSLDFFYREREKRLSYLNHDIEFLFFFSVICRQ